MLVAGVAVGVATIAAVGSLAGTISDDVREGARSVIGGDVSLRLFHHPADAEQRTFIAEVGAYSEVIKLRARTRTADGSASTLAEVEGVDAAYPLYGAVDFEPPVALAEALAERDGIRGAVVDRRLLDALNVNVGERLRLGPAMVKVRAVFRDETGRSVGPVSLGPRVLVAGEALAGTELTAPGAPVYWYYLVRLSEGADSRAWIAALERRFPDAGWRIVDAADGVPGMERVVDVGRALLLLIAVAVVLIGGVGVACAVRSHIERRVGTIAILKSLGATERLISATYFVQVMLAAGLAVLLGLAVGGAAPAALALARPDLLPEAGEAVHFDALATAAAFGLLATAAFGAWSLGRIRHVTPQHLFRDLVAPIRRHWMARAVIVAAMAAALAFLLFATVGMPLIAGLFVAGAALAVTVFLLLGRALAWTAGRCARMCGAEPRLALSSLARPGAATVPVVAALGLCLTLLVAIRAVEDNATHYLAETVPKDAPGLAVLNLPPAEGASFEAGVGAIAGVERVERMPFVHARIARVEGRPLRQEDIPRDIAWAVRGDRGVSWAATPPADSEIAAGEWWAVGHTGPPLVSLDAEVARRLGISVGDALTLNMHGELLTGTVANLRRIDWTRLQLDFPIVLSPPPEPPPYRELAAVWADEAALGAVERLVEESFPAAASLRIGPVLEQLGAAIRGVTGALGMLSAAAVAAAVVVLAGSLAATWRVRLRDMVILRMIGARPRQLAFAGMLELALLGIATAAIAGVLGTLMAYGIVSRIAPDAWILRPAVPAWLAAVAVAGMAIAGLVLPRNALRHSPMAFLRREV